MIGNYKYSVDPKGRITIPSKLRKELGKVVYITKDYDGALSLRTKEEFELMKSSLLDKNNLSKESRLLQRFFLGNTFEVDIDSQGRILLSKYLIEQTDITNEVVIVAAGNKIEIFSPELWNKIMEEANNGALEKAAEKLNGL